MIRFALAALLALSFWMGLGILAVSDSPASVRVGLLPPWWLAGLLVVVLGGALVWRRASTCVLAPAAIAGLCLLPWLPLRVPAAVLLWTGPLALLPWLGAGVAVLSSRAGRLPWATKLCTPRTATRAAFAAALVFYAGGYALVSERHPGGDEPHYLIISQSLLADGDLRIQNNHDNGEYAGFVAEELRPDFLRRGTDGQIYSIHAPGLPVLMLPAYALFGGAGAVAFLILMAAAGAALLWRTAFDLTGDAGAAWMAWAGAALSVPFVFHAFAVFPDMPASVFALIGLRALMRATRGDEGAGRGYWLLVGAALAGLPWLHTRYAILAGVLGFALAATLVRKPPGLAACAALFAAPIVSAAGWFGYFWVIYGTPSPSAPYGGYTQTAVANLLPGVTGLLFDAQFGLMATAPILAWAIVGIVTGALGKHARESGPGVRLAAVTLVALCLPYVAASGAYRMWWGGAGAPARFVVPLVLPLGVALAIAWTTARSRTTRALMIGAATVSVWLTIVMLVVDGGRLAYNTRDGVTLWAAWASPVVDLVGALPSIHRGPAVTALAQTLVWIGAGALAWLLLRAVERRSGTEVAWFALVAPLAVAAGGMSAVAASWAVVAAEPGRPASQSRLLAAMPRWPRGHGIVIDGSAGLVPHIDAHSANALVAELHIPGIEHPTHVELPPLPAGRYRLEARAREPLLAPLTVRIGREHLPAATLDLSASPAGVASPPLDLTFPVAVPQWDVSMPGARGAVPVDLRVHPLALLRQAGGLRGTARQAVAYHPWLAFFMDDGAYPEPDGFWIRPSRDVSIVVGHPDAFSAVRMTIRNVPVANRLEVTAGKWRDTLVLEPGAERVLIAPPPGPPRATVLRLRVDRGAKPSSFEPGSRDHRELGAWIRLER